MELFLNIVAIVTIFAFLAIWRVHWARQPGRGDRNATREGLAIGCLAILAFFAISMTDDLQDDLMILDECSSSQSRLVVLSATHHLYREGVRTHAANVAILADAIILDLQCLTTAMARAAWPSPLLISYHLLPTRASPLFV